MAGSISKRNQLDQDQMQGFPFIYKVLEECLTKNTRDFKLAGISEEFSNTEDLLFD